MIVRRRVLASVGVFLLAAVLSAGSLADATSQTDPSLLAQMRSPGPVRLIVEFQGTPRALAGNGVSAAAYENVFARFRSDLQSDNEGANSAKRGNETRTIRREYSTLFFGAAVTVPPADLDRLRRLPYVRAVHRDTEVRALATGEVVDARVGVNAQNLGVRGAGMVVAVIDTGIDYTHPALGSGFGPGQKVAGGWDFVNDDADPMDDHGHGTHVAGTVAANAADLIGVAPDATLLAYKVLGAGGSGSTSDIIAAIERAADPNQDGDFSDRAHVINLSLGGPGTAEDAISRAVDNASAAGVVVIVAAGNDGATASIGSPGVAATAVTVGAIDSAGKVAPFSSRGPTPKHLAFKPDLSAPGVAIVSSIPGGKTQAFNGTSMATPHVAGLAALLRQLHPEWTPAEVKAALIAGAGESTEPSLARGAGRADGVRANAAAVIADVSGIMFGLRPEATGTWEETRTIALRNRSSEPQSLAVTTKGAVAGLQISVEPSSIQLAPGETKSVAVKIIGDNETVAFPEEAIISGDVRFSGATTFSIPWGLVRAARATITLDFTPSSLIIPISRSKRQAFQYDYDAAELFVPPGSEPWTFMVGHAQKDEEDDSFVQTLVVLENVVLTGDMIVPLQLASATEELTIDGRAPDGSLLRELPVEEWRKRYLLDLRIMFRDGDRAFDFGIVSYDTRALRTPPLSSRFTILARESYVDLDAMRGYHFEPVPEIGVSGSKTIEPSSPYRKARLRWESKSNRTPFVVCNQSSFIINTFSGIGDLGCMTTTIDRAAAFDYWTMDEPVTDSFGGLKFIVGRSESQTFRGTPEGIVASDEMVPPVTSARIPDGAEAWVGSGVAFPYFFVGTGAKQFSWPFWGLRGGFGELYTQPTLTAWSVYDASGSLLQTGVHGPGYPDLPPPTAGTRFVATRGSLEVAGHRSLGTIEARFGANSEDLATPAITSFRIEGGDEQPTARFAIGEATTLHFSAADFAASGYFKTQPSSPEATRAFYRARGSIDWQPLPVVLAGSENGERRELRHYPAGDIFRVDLTPATALANSAVDLRVEVEDASGNRLSWTQEPAFFVGTVEDEPGRGRAVGR